MKMSALRERGEKKWVPVVGFDGDVEICIVPGEYNVFIPAAQGAMTETVRRLICSQLFVDFRGITEDDEKTPVPNTVDNRMDMLNAVEIYGAIQTAVVSAGVAEIEEKKSAA